MKVKLLLRVVGSILMVSATIKTLYPFEVVAYPLLIASAVIGFIFIIADLFPKSVVYGIISVVIFSALLFNEINPDWRLNDPKGILIGVMTALYATVFGLLALDQKGKKSYFGSNSE